MKKTLLTAIALATLLAGSASRAQAQAETERPKWRRRFQGTDLEGAFGKGLIDKLMR